MKISEIQNNSRNIELVAAVISIDEPREVDTRYGPALICDAIIDDGSSRIKWRLWRQQVKMVRVGDEVKIENGFIRTFYGEKVLNLGSDGKITVVRKNVEIK